MGVDALPMKKPSKSPVSRDLSAPPSALASSRTSAQPTHPEAPKENAFSKPLAPNTQPNALSSATQPPMTTNAQVPPLANPSLELASALTSTKPTTTTTTTFATMTSSLFLLYFFVNP